ncbi:MAG: hypothetical protein VKO44_09150 [Cyanobacteriota bacterium]|nr:hypothetical protein [Cyanobacteriota bacterium]
MVIEPPGDPCSVDASWQLDPQHFPRRIDLDLSPEVHAKLQRLAAATGRSLSEAAQDLLSRTLFSDQEELN